MTVNVEHALWREGCNLHYWLSGDAANPVVVFCHGASLDHQMFDPQVPLLTEAGYRVLTWDIRGHGQSKPIGLAFDFEIAAADLSAILDWEGVEDLVLIGHSGGGYVAQHFLSSFPDRVKALAVIGSTDLSVRPSAARKMAYRLMPHLYRLIPDRMLRQQFARHMGVSEEVEKYALRATNRLSRDEFIEVFSAAAKVLLEDPGFGDGYRINVPLLIAFGEHDNTNGGIVKSDAKRWASASRRAGILPIPDAGHNANQDNADFFNAALIEWLKAQSPKAK